MFQQEMEEGVMVDALEAFAHGDITYADLQAVERVCLQATYW